MSVKSEGVVYLVRAGDREKNVYRCECGSDVFLVNEIYSDIGFCTYCHDEHVDLSDVFVFEAFAKVV